ncbi:MAG: tetratricopeptide repeat protein [Candidatus Omnitrophica bacterium]|nr:tetratricopeptide repeat protein [Candidatus Omnitrophota bacterium]
MSHNSSFSRLRQELDQAITYGTKKAATKLARFALVQAKNRKLPGEIEYFQGQLEILKSNFVSAIEHFDKAIKHNPRDGAAYNDRALCMVEIGIIDETFAYFDQGIAVEPDYATIYHNKGWLLNNIGRHTEAIGCFQKALELEPDRPVTYDNLADARVNLGDFRGALEAYRKVLELLKPKSCPGIRKEIKKQIKVLEKKVE